MLKDTICMRYSDFTFEKAKKACPACGAKKIVYAFHSPKAQNCIKGFRVDRCARCEMHFVNPQPTQASLSRYYVTADRSLETGLRVRLNKEYRTRLFNEIVDPFRKHLRKGKVLDCGCGMGLFVKFLKDRGYNSYGIDVSRKAVEDGAQKLGLTTLHCGDLKDLPRQTRFDAVTAFATLEHLKDPAGFIKKTTRILKPGGLLVLRYPSADSLQFSKLKMWFNWIQTPYHLFFFSQRAIENILRKNGFKIIQTEGIPLTWHWCRGIAASFKMQKEYAVWRRKNRKFIRFTKEIDRMFDSIALRFQRSSVVHVYARYQGNHRKGAALP